MSALFGWDAPSTKERRGVNPLDASSTEMTRTGSSVGRGPRAAGRLGGADGGRFLWGREYPKMDHAMVVPLRECTKTHFIVRFKRVLGWIIFLKFFC